MDKKQLIIQIKTEIKLYASLIKQNKELFKHNQRQKSKGLNDIKPLLEYPLFHIKHCYAYYYYRDTVKRYLTSLHIVYNILRHNKIHTNKDKEYVPHVEEFIEECIQRFTKCKEEE